MGGLSKISKVLRCGSLVVQVKGQCSAEVMVLCMENFTAFRRHLILPGDDTMQACIIWK
jgi:hypothetical protein